MIGDRSRRGTGTWRFFCAPAGGLLGGLGAVEASVGATAFAAVLVVLTIVAVVMSTLLLYQGWSRGSRR